MSASVVAESASAASAAAAVIEINDDSSDEEEEVIVNQQKKQPRLRRRSARLAKLATKTSSPPPPPPGMDGASWKLIQQIQANDTNDNNKNDDVQVLDDDIYVQEVVLPNKKKRSRLGAVFSSQEEQSLALAAQLQEEEERQQKRQKEEEKLSLSIAKVLQEQYKEEEERVAKIHRPTPQQVLENLKPCQQQAISYVQAKAKTMHEKALPTLKKRVVSLGLKEKDLTNCLDYIRDDAPIIIHLSPDSLTKVVKDTHYRSLFETNTSGGTRNTSSREMWERAMFGNCYDGAAPFDRPKYGCLNVTGDIQGVKSARGYGACFLLLHQHVRHRTTFFNRDTGGFMSSSATLATSEYYAHILQEYNDTELKAAINVATTSRIAGAENTCAQYKEVQIHGPVCLATDVQALSVPGREKDATKQLKKDVLEFQKMAKCNVLWQGDLVGATGAGAGAP